VTTRWRESFGASWRDAGFPLCPDARAHVEAFHRDATRLSSRHVGVVGVCGFRTDTTRARAKPALICMRPARPHLKDAARPRAIRACKGQRASHLFRTVLRTRCTGCLTFAGCPFAKDSALRSWEKFTGPRSSRSRSSALLIIEYFYHANQVRVKYMGIVYQRVDGVRLGDSVLISLISVRLINQCRIRRLDVETPSANRFAATTD